VIVTRKRKPRRQYWRVVVPLTVIAVLAAAFAWPPSRARLHALPPVGSAMDAVGATFDAGALRSAVHQRDRRIADLQRQINGLHGEIQARDKQISALTTQTNQLGQRLAEAPQSPPGGAGAPVPGPSASPRTDPQVQRTAQIWNEMDPQAAAKIAERLPDAFVAQVFAKMEAGQVGEILGAMPAKLAARLTATRLASNTGVAPAKTRAALR